MTRHAINSPKKHRISVSGGDACFGVLTVFCLLLILWHPEIAIASVRRGLDICAKTVIPALFPFMVVSDLLVSSGIGAHLLRPVLPLLRKIFCLPDVGCCAVLLGMLCGFPVGAVCAMNGLRAGQLTREEVQRVLLFSGNASSAFLINAVGLSLWGNQDFGGCLWITLLCCQLTVGFLFTHCSAKKTERSITEEVFLPPQRSLSRSILLTHAVQASCQAMLSVCSYVIFFSALMGTLHAVLDGVGAPGFCKTLLFCIFELTGGTDAAASLSSPLWGAALTAFAVGWGGVSVHCQTLSACDGGQLRFGKYFLAKLAQGILCALIFSMIAAGFPQLLIHSAQASAPAESADTLPLVTLLFLLTVALLGIAKAAARWRQRHTVSPCQQDSTAAYPPPSHRWPPADRTPIPPLANCRKAFERKKSDVSPTPHTVASPLRSGTGSRHQG